MGRWITDENGESVWVGDGKPPQYPVDPFETALSKTSREFQATARQVQSSVASRDNLVQAMAEITSPGLTMTQRAEMLKKRGLAQGGVADIEKQILGGEITYAGLQQQANAIATGLQTDYDTLASLDPLTTFDLFPQAAADSSRLKFARTLLGEGEGAGAKTTYGVQIMKNGDVVRTGTDGSFSVVDHRPEYADKNVQVQTNEMTGEARALVFDDQGNVVSTKSLGRVAFPQIDPERKFRFDVLNAAATLETSLQGVELQRRGQVIQAIGDDFSRQVMVGNLAVNEATLNLDRMDKAMTQRRAERQDLLKYGVTRASLRTNSAGETVTRLPFADQWASIMSAATGRTFSPDQFELGTTWVSPDQAATDVMAGSGVSSAVPGLSSGLQSARDAINNVLGTPLGDSVVTKKIMDAALSVPGVS